MVLFIHVMIAFMKKKKIYKAIMATEKNIFLEKLSVKPKISKINNCTEGWY